MKKFHANLTEKIAKKFSTKIPKPGEILPEKFEKLLGKFYLKKLKKTAGKNNRKTVNKIFPIKFKKLAGKFNRKIQKIAGNLKKNIRNV